MQNLLISLDLATIAGSSCTNRIGLYILHPSACENLPSLHSDTSQMVGALQLQAHEILVHETPKPVKIGYRCYATVLQSSTLHCLDEVAASATPTAHAEQTGRQRIRLCREHHARLHATQGQEAQMNA